MLQSDRDTLENQAVVQNRLSRQPRFSEFEEKKENIGLTEMPSDKLGMREINIQRLDVQIM